MSQYQMFINRVTMSSQELADFLYWFPHANLSTEGETL